MTGDLHQIRRRQLDADRQRERRRRLREGIIVVPVEVSFDVVDALVDARKLEAWDEDDKGKVGEAASDALYEWAGVSRRDGSDSSDVAEYEHDEEQEV